MLFCMVHIMIQITFSDYKQNQTKDYEIYRNTRHYLMLAKIYMNNRVMSS